MLPSIGKTKILKITSVWSRLLALLEKESQIYLPALSSIPSPWIASKRKSRSKKMYSGAL